LTTLLDSKYQVVKGLELSVLIRGEDRAKVFKEHGVNPIQFRDLDDSEALTKAASQHDSTHQSSWFARVSTNLCSVVINTASGFHSEAARALVLGLGQRRKATGQEVYYFHVRGTPISLNAPC
jgi:hypothetical protein